METNLSFSAFITSNAISAGFVCFAIILYLLKFDGCKATTFICNLQIFRRKNERNLQRWTYDSLSRHKKEPWRFPISSCCFLFVLFVVYHFFA